MSQHSVISGIRYLVRGFESLTRPGLKRYVLIPLIINLLLFGFLIGFGFQGVHHLMILLPHWLHWLSWIVYPLFFMASSIIMIYLFTILANLLGLPFNSLLSEKTQILIKGEKPNQDEGLMDALKDTPRVLKREWQIIKYFLLRAIILLILFFIPFVNIIASILWFIFGCWMMAIQYVDYTMDNHRIEFAETHRFLKKHCLTSLGFGCAVVIASMIPIVNFIVMPAAVIGGTLMYLENKEANHAKK